VGGEGEGVDSRFTVLVHGDPAWACHMAYCKALAEQVFGGLSRTCGAEHKIPGGAGRVDRAREVVPWLLYLDMRLINTVGVIGCFERQPTALISLRCVALDPAKDGGVLDGHATFPQAFCHIPIT
jgi:hypothetical protein